MTQQDELLDLVDEHDQVIDTKPRSEVYAAGLTNFRVINAFVINHKGEIWVPRRTASKRIFPLCLDMSVGGHVETGESYDDAFKRETKEELNIDTEKARVRLLGHLTPHEHGVSAFMEVYEIEVHDTPQYNQADFVEHFWLTPAELRRKLQAGDKAKDDLLRLVNFFYR